MHIIPKAFSGDAVTVVLAADEGYVPYLGVALSSVLTHAASSRPYDIVLLLSGVSRASTDRLLSMARGRESVSIRAFDLSDLITLATLPRVGYYSTAIYLRLFAPYLMREYDRAVYLDSDLVVMRDIAELYDTPLDGALFGAVRDIGMLMHYYTEGRELLPKSYFREQLEGLSPEEYFNSGVLLWNFSLHRETVSVERLFSAVAREGSSYPDQDALNLLARGRVRYLPMAWNTLPETGGNRTVRAMRTVVPEEHFSDYLAAREHPAVIHYAMREKPWNSPHTLDAPLFLPFWRYALESPFGALIFARFCRTAKGEDALYLASALALPIALVHEGRDLLYVVRDRVLLRLGRCALRLDEVREENGALVLSGTLPYYLSDELSAIALTFTDGEDTFTANLSPSLRRRESVYPFLADFSVRLPLAYATRALRPVCELHGARVGRPINFSRHFPIDRTLGGQYAKIGDTLLSYSHGALTLAPATRENLSTAEHAFRRSLRHSDRKGDRKARLLRPIVFLLRRLRRRPLVLLRDNCLAADNATALAHYLKKEGKVRPVLAYRKTDRLPVALDRELSLVRIGSRRFKLLSLLADATCASVIDRGFLDPFRDSIDAYRDLLLSRPFVFLQHGVITQDLSREHGRDVYRPTGFVVSSEYERRALLSPSYGYRRDEVWLTGLARFDHLTGGERKYITVLFTWRRALSLRREYTEEGARRLVASTYFRTLYALLHHPDLHRAARRCGYEIAFRTHPIFDAYAHLFLGGTERVRDLSHTPYREIFSESALVITDYSSAIFDHLYLGRPVLYCQCDRESFFDGSHAYDKSDFSYENDGFGEVEHTVDATVRRAVEYMESGCVMKEKYRRRLDDFFTHRDRDNCRRIAEKLYALVRKRGSRMDLNFKETSRKGSPS